MSDASSMGNVKVAARAGQPITARITATGWQIGEGDALIIVADARGGVAEVAAHDGEALENRTALVALVSTSEEADAAYDAGATHILFDGGNLDEWARVLRFAARFVRRLRGQSRVRRSDDRPAAPDAVAVAIDAWPADGAPPMAAIVALTRFDVVNAAFGRAAGDALLAAAASRIAAQLPDVARIARATGATFAVAAPADDTMAARIEEALAAPFEIDGAAIHVGARIGLAKAAAGESGERLLQRALEALSAARASEGAGAIIADARGDAPTERLAADLHRAMDRGEIELLFQPQVAMATGVIAGVEALARWQHPRLGPLGAERLFAAAERADLGVALSDHIQALALARAAAWPTALAALRIAINVTAQDLARPEFVRRFLGRIADSGIGCARVTMEITESGLIGDLGAAAGLLAQVRMAGCRVAIDDFGTGYSSLTYLKALPLDYLKIDRGLTQDIAGSERDRVVVRGVIAMARSLGLETIVEGVETEEQRALLAAEGCDFYQGFLCSPPVDDAGLAAIVGG